MDTNLVGVLINYCLLHQELNIMTIIIVRILAITQVYLLSGILYLEQAKTILNIFKNTQLLSINKLKYLNQTDLILYSIQFIQTITYIYAIYLSF